MAQCTVATVETWHPVNLPHLLSCSILRTKSFSAHGARCSSPCRRKPHEQPQQSGIGKSLLLQPVCNCSTFITVYGRALFEKRACQQSVLVVAVGWKSYKHVANVHQQVCYDDALH